METILVAVDFSENTELVMAQAVELCRAVDGTLYLVHVTSDALRASYQSTQFYGAVSEYGVAPAGDVKMARDLCAEEYKKEHCALQNLAGSLREKRVDAQALLLKGHAAELILKEAQKVKADVIVMGSHGHGMLRKMLMGSVAEAVLKDAPCGVLIVPAAHAAAKRA